LVGSFDDQSITESFYTEQPLTRDSNIPVTKKRDAVEQVDHVRVMAMHFWHGNGMEMRTLWSVGGDRCGERKQRRRRSIIH
jgi:hypothetical protein